MAFPTKTVYLTIDLGSVGNLQAQEVIRARATGYHNLINEVVDMLSNLPQYGGTLDAEVLGSDGTAATGTVTWTAAAAKGSGDVNGKAFTFLAGSAGACTVTVGDVTGITITGSGTAATDATALAAAISAAYVAAHPAPQTQPVVTANAGDVRIVWGAKGDQGNTIATVVTATGGAKLSASGATLTGGTPTGALGNSVVNGKTVAYGSVTSGETAAQTAARIDALAKADAPTCLLANPSCVLATDVVLTFTARIPPQIASVGNKLTLTASVGTASGATFAGGVDAATTNKKGSL